jgi:EAL domain-containing protein (putative c-di-GMP-specific phosphodiesterase class I)
MARRQGESGWLGEALRSSLSFTSPDERDPEPRLPFALTYTLDLCANTVTWGPAAHGMDIEPGDLPRSAKGFLQMIEPGSGTGPLDAIRAGAAARHYRARYGLRLSAERVVMADDEGCWLADNGGRPAIIHGILHLQSEGAPSIAFTLRSHLLADLGRIMKDSRRVTLIVGRVKGEDDYATASTEIMRAIRPILRQGDAITRDGGGCFALILRSCMPDDADVAMRRVLDLIDAHSLVGGEAVTLASASTTDGLCKPLTLLHRAHDALSRATAAGQPFLAFSDRQDELERVGTDAADIVDALNDRRLGLLRDPIADGSGQSPLFSARPCLLSPRGSVLRAEDIAQSMARAGQSLLLDTRMLELASDHLAKNARHVLTLPLATSSLHNPEWFGALAAQLGRNLGIAPRLIIRLSADAFAKPEALRARLDALKALGPAIAADGFGTGHLRSRQLRDCPLDLLMIDGRLTSSLSRSLDMRLHMRALIGLAHQRGMATVAQWVRDEETAKRLDHWGVDYIQGPWAGTSVAPARRTVQQPAATRLKRAAWG